MWKQNGHWTRPIRRTFPQSVPFLAHLLFDLCFSHSKNGLWFFSFRFHQIANAVNSEKLCAKYAFLLFSRCSYLSHTISATKKVNGEENYLFRLNKQVFIDLAQ